MLGREEDAMVVVGRRVLVSLVGWSGKLGLGFEHSGGEFSCPFPSRSRSASSSPSCPQLISGLGGILFIYSRAFKSSLLS